MEKVEPPHIGILKHEKVGYGEQLLMEMLETAGLVASVIDPLHTVYGDGDQGIFPDIVLGRCEISSFTEQAFSAYLSYFEECSSRSIPVINPREFLLRGQDKYLTHISLRRYLQERGIADFINPPTWQTYDREEAFRIALKEIEQYGSAVIKRACSGRGEGIYLVKNREQMEEILLNKFTPLESILIQRTIVKERNESGNYRDIRVLACRDTRTYIPEVVGAYHRNASDATEFLTNISQGGFPTPMEDIDQKLVTYTQWVMDATHGDVAGIDFIRDVDGRYWFEEVNIAFETSKQTIDLIGDQIWRRVVTLILSKIE